MTQENILPDYISELLEDGTLEDQTKVQSFEYETPEAGPTYARLVEYIELGTHERKAFKGKEKAPAPKVRLTFELLGKRHLKEITVGGVKKIVGQTISVTWDKIINEKSKFYKLLSRLQAAVPAKAQKTHMATFLNEAVKCKIVHAEVGEGADKKTYANIDWDSIDAPMYQDEDENLLPYKVPAATVPIKLFLFDKPNKATWDSLFIDGEREVKDDKGNTKTVSKNFIQIQILSALNFSGSALESLLITGGDMPDLSKEADVPSHEEGEAEEAPAPAAKAKATTKTTKSAAAAMADLGLVE